MHTERLSTSDPQERARACARAAELLRDGQLVGLPTETVYGVGARADLAEAVARLRDLKGRDADKPFAVVFADVDTALSHGHGVSAAGRRLAARFWPGPITLVVDDGEGDSVGLRVPGSDVTREVLRRVGAPVALPSANPAAQAPARDADGVLKYFDGRILAVVDGGRAPIGTASAVVDVRGDAPHVLREGILSRDEIRRAAALGVLFVCSGNTCRSPMAAALTRSLLARRLRVPVDELEARGYRVESAGLFAGPGHPASSGARHAMASRDIDLTTHQSQPLTGRLLAEHHHVYGMTAQIVDGLRQVSPHPERIQHVDPDGRDVVDPFGGSDDVYERCATEIEGKVARVVERLSG